MFLLNIFQNSDGTLAWDNLLILLAALVAGILLNRFLVRQTENRKYAKELNEWENKYKRVENEFKAHKSAIQSAEKHNEKALAEMTQRVKSLEGDIRALSEEKNKYHGQVMAKETELRNYSQQVTDLDDQLKSLKAAMAKADAEWNARLQSAKEALTRASAWETRVRSAEDETQKARAALSVAERKKLEAELRLKATAEYAAKVIPLENELQMAKDKLASMEQDVVSLQGRISGQDEKLAVQAAAKEIAEGQEARIKALQGELAMLKNNSGILQHELEIKQAANVSLQKEIENLRQAMKGVDKPEPFMAIDHSLKDSIESESSSSL